MPKVQVIHEISGLENFVWDEPTIAAPGPGQAHIRAFASDAVLH